MKCAQCGSSHPLHAYMGYPIFSGYWCDNCEEFTATCSRLLLWFLEFFVAPWVDGFAICISDERITEEGER